MTYPILDSVVNQPVKIPFVSTNNVTGIVSFTNVFLLKDGVVNAATVTTVEIGNGLYVATFTPTTTGKYALYIEKFVQGAVNIVTKSLYTFIQNLEDEALGSWSWDKNTGILQFMRQDGSTMAGFAVVDNLTTASRARTSP